MDKTPTYRDLALFQIKAYILRLKCCFNNFLKPVKKHSLYQSNGSRLLAESISDLWDHSAEPAEEILQAGKIHNLRIASKAIDGCHIPANQMFSFWRQIGRPMRIRGYVKGRELRQGCIIPTIGGGLCQLSNALYDAASKANFTIHERHAHTQIIKGSLAEQGRDATVFWNYVDLRFGWSKAFFIKVALTSDKLTVQLWENND
jgi:vancomycin resistance protein YoaR